ncbi:MAG: twin-arginine translocase TatA/TatE family subunit [Planctomycetia bacterium]|nr:twin-arginine translocase TatA/TatE family subunit [Planctomycetia bacterium]
MIGFMTEIHTILPLGLFDFGSIFVLGLLAVLLFGGDLPRMGRKFGKYYSEFQRTVGTFKREVSSVVSDITSEIEDTSPRSSSRTSSSSPSSSERKSTMDDDDVEAVAPKFEPPKK